MKGYIKGISLFLILSMMFCVAGCGGSDSGNNDSSSQTDGSSSGDDANVEASASEDYFTWNGNIITGLTESGAEQESLVIPARCEGFDGRILRDTENNVASVTFESDEDIELNGAFRSAEELKSISLPANLTTIADLEFARCPSLEEITIPSGVTSIGAYAFQNDTSLTTVKFEGDVTEIMMHAFDGCTSLTTIELPDTITSIDEYAFYECASLETITLPSSLTSVGEFAFANSGLTTITVPEDLELEASATTSFVQSGHEVTVNVVEGSWMDQNFEIVFDGAFVKNISG